MTISFYVPISYFVEPVSRGRNPSGGNAFDFFINRIDVDRVVKENGRHVFGQNILELNVFPVNRFNVLQGPGFFQDAVNVPVGPDSQISARVFGLGRMPDRKSVVRERV